MLQRPGCYNRCEPASFGTYERSDLLFWKTAGHRCAAVSPIGCRTGPAHVFSATGINKAERVVHLGVRQVCQAMSRFITLPWDVVECLQV